jgi:hypothetical protein
LLWSPIGPQGEELMSQIQPTTYEVRIRGRLSPRLRAAFEGLEIAEIPVQTALYGVIADQAALRGLLDQIQSYGLELVEVRSYQPAPATDPGRSPINDGDARP